VERGRQVCRDDVVPFFRREVLDRRDELYARIIDEYVNAAEAVDGIFYHRGDFNRLNHVRGRENDLAGAGIIDSAHCRIDLILVAQPVHHDVCAGCGEAACNTEADAARRAIPRPMPLVDPVTSEFFPASKWLCPVPVLLTTASLTLPSHWRAASKRRGKE
jgi:hypothetical protein